MDGSMLPTCYRPSSMLSGGLEIPLILTFRSLRYNTHQNMKDFMTKLYCYDNEPDNVESESDDETCLDIKDNTVVVESDSEVAVAKAKKRKITIVHDDSEEEKSDIEEGKKTKTKFMESDSEISQTVNPNTNRFATKTQKVTESLDIDIGMNMNVENNITSE